MPFSFTLSNPPDLFPKIPNELLYAEIKGFIIKYSSVGFDFEVKQVYNGLDGSIKVNILCEGDTEVQIVSFSLLHFIVYLHQKQIEAINNLGWQIVKI